MNSINRPDRVKLVMAFFFIYFIWGSTYLAIVYAIDTIPPFIMAGIRFTLAGAILFIFLKLRGIPTPGLKQFWQLSVVGTFLFLGGNGLVVWAEQYIASGLAALLVALLPLWMIALDWLWAGGPPPTLRGCLGITMGIVGVIVLLDPGQLATTNIHMSGAMMTLLASILWAIGSIYSKKFSQPESIFMSAACQMIGGGIAILLTSLILGEWSHFSPTEISTVSVAAFCYLLFFGSIVAISSYVYLLKHASAASVSTYAFVNPAIAIFLGWVIADEVINLHIISGAMIILAGVVLVITAQNTRLTKTK